MKKILLTNNSLLINKEFDEVYSDSPYIAEKYKKVLYLDTLLDENIEEKIHSIRKKGFLLNDRIIKAFFPHFDNRNVKLIDIIKEFTNIFINTTKFLNLANRFQNDEITVGITPHELNNTTDRIIGRFENVYYWIAECLKLKNVKLICKNLELTTDLDPKDKPINSWFLRLIDLDKKVLIFNLKKKLGLIKSQKKNIYIYNSNTALREIEPYLYDKGFSYCKLPIDNFKNYDSNYKINEYKLKRIIDESFENNFFENNFKKIIFVVYKRVIQKYLEKQVYTNKVISKLDKSISVVLANAFQDSFDSLIFTKQLQDNGFKIVEIFHGLSKGFASTQHIKFYESDVVDMVLCFSNAEKKVFKKYDPTCKVYPISTVQETKKIRLKKFQRFYVCKMLNISNKKNVLYPSLSYPINNANQYGHKPNDIDRFKTEKKIITTLSKINKRSIYKTYPNRCYVDSNILIDYAKSFKNIKVVSEKFDFRYINTIGDLFILGPMTGSSTLMWMLGLNKPIIHLKTQKFKTFSNDALKIIDKIFINIEIDEEGWETRLLDMLNKPYDELLKIWKLKQKFRDLYDEDWLLGTNLHAGKLGAKFIEKLILENENKIIT